MSNREPTPTPEYKALEEFVVNNDELLQLEERIGRFNIFDALGIVNAEIRHSNFLAWLLDPNESHGQGPLFLKAILMDLLRQSPHTLRAINPVKIDGAELRGVEVRREWRNIDILITCKDPNFVIAIENKVGSKEHSKQLDRYRKTVKDNFGSIPNQFVFLTRDGDEPTDEDWTIYTYEDIHRVLLRVRKTNATSLGDDVLTFLDHYIRLIGSRFMDDPKIDELCQTIYKNHRQALDLILERISTAPAYDRVKQTVTDSPAWSVLHTTKKNIYTTLKSLEWMPSRLTEPKPVHRSWIIFNFIWYSDTFKLEVFIGEAKDADKRSSLINFFHANQKKYNLRMPKNPGPRYTTLRSHRIGSWKNTDPNEDDFVRKTQELMSMYEEQFKTLSDEIRPIIEAWDKNK